jgi:muconolactone D-isomerase
VVEFMVRIDIRTPHDLDPAELAALQAAETARARELIAQGSLRRIWRIPGRRSNISLYDVADATELHAALSSLPLFPYMQIEVQALATHPLEAPAGQPHSSR